MNFAEGFSSNYELCDPDVCVRALAHVTTDRGNGLTEARLDYWQSEPDMVLVQFGEKVGDIDATTDRSLLEAACDPKAPEGLIVNEGNTRIMKFSGELLLIFDFPHGFATVRIPVASAEEYLRKTYVIVPRDGEELTTSAIFDRRTAELEEALEMHSEDWDPWEEFDALAGEC